MSHPRQSDTGNTGPGAYAAFFDLLDLAPALLFAQYAFMRRPIARRAAALIGRRRLAGGAAVLATFGRFVVGVALTAAAARLFAQ